MSEPSQLIVRVHIEPTQFARWQQHSLASARSFSKEFLSWLASKRWHGDGSAAQMIADVSPPENAAQWCSDFSEGPYAMHYQPIRDRYDPASGIWTWVISNYAENYYDFIQDLNVLRQIAPFAKTEPASHVAIVPLWFGAGFKEPDAILEIRDGKARFIDSAPREFITWAQQLMKEIEHKTP